MKIKKLAVICSLLIGTSFAAAKDNVIEIRYGIWDRVQLPAVEQIISEFEAKNPDIKIIVELTPWSQYWIKLAAAASGGAAADVFWMSMEGADVYAKNGLLEPIDKYVIESGLKLDEYPSYTVDAYNFDGKQYGIPRDVDAIGVWYNKTIFDDANVEYPKAGWTWDQMVGTARAIKSKTKSTNFPLMMELSEGQNSYFNLIIQSGNDIISADKKSVSIATPSAISAYKKVQELMNEGLMPNAQQISELVNDEVFQAGRAAMTYGGSWLALPFSESETLNNNFGVVPMPKIINSNGVSHSIGYTMSSKSEHKGEAWRFMEFLGSDRAQVILGSSKTVIPAKKAQRDSWYQAFDKIDVTPFSVSLDEATGLPTGGNTAKWQAILADGLKRVWLGDDPEKTMPKIEKRIQRVLDKG